MSENYAEIYETLKKENADVDMGCVLAADGKILFNSGAWDLTADAAKLLKTWKEHGPRIEVQGTGYSVLRSEPESLVSTNLARKGSVVGSVTKGGNFFVAHLVPVSVEQAGKDYMDVARAAAKMK
ncbi:MAG: hypothetical protein GYA24_10255 [Candidatus Lokiarchaeota archaeon]|nr:hypothetical protein [Candidatus Lokiarchaeota archaeon]